MREAPQTKSRLQRLWDHHSDTPGEVQQLRVRGVKSFTRAYWCIVIDGKRFGVLGENFENARKKIIGERNRDDVLHDLHPMGD